MKSDTSTLSSIIAPAERLRLIAEQLQARNLDAYYVPPEDEHLNEYLPENKKRIQWLTGFTGESAPLLVLPDKLHLYVDGRFHLQVDDEVDPAVTTVHKLPPDQSGDKCIAAALNEMLEQGKEKIIVGFNPFIVSPSRLASLEKQTPSDNIQWQSITPDLVDQVWSDRHDQASEPAYQLDTRITGQSVEEKLSRIREDMKKLNAVILPVTRLDEVCWLYNLRGKDIPYNPVLESYAILTENEAFLFTQPAKVSESLRQSLAAQGIQVKPYESYPQTLKELCAPEGSGPQKVLIDKSAVTMGTLDVVAGPAEVIEAEHPVMMRKAIKNEVELQRMHLAHERASRAIIRHLASTELAFECGKPLNEETLRADLEQKYAEEDEFFELSFPTIPGVGANSAIIHYSHADPNQVARASEFYLLDSGCQYLGGTTDTTRTTVFGEADLLKKERYTAVLKAHIACASLIFPEGTKGSQIDAVCRAPLWSQGLDFAHGTGHGVGAFLNVHEGPNRISKVCSVIFQPGMVTSIEPGYYEKDWGGIRLENLYYVVEAKEKPPFMERKWLRFEPLTLVPFEMKLILFEQLTAHECAWLKAYYQRIWDTLSPTLDTDETDWLARQTAIPVDWIKRLRNA